MTPKYALKDLLVGSGSIIGREIILKNSLIMLVSMKILRIDH